MNSNIVHLFPGMDEVENSKNGLTTTNKDVEDLLSHENFIDEFKDFLMSKYFSKPDTNCLENFSKLLKTFIFIHRMDIELKKIRDNNFVIVKWKEIFNKLKVDRKSTLWWMKSFLINLFENSPNIYFDNYIVGVIISYNIWLTMYIESLDNELINEL